jgi:hypothetical protein
MVVGLVIQVLSGRMGGAPNGRLMIVSASGLMKTLFR